MPEGDSAYRTAHHLTRALAGRTADRVELRVPRLGGYPLNGLRIDGCVARGKHLLLHIGALTLHTHLGMDGSWLILPPGRRSLSPPDRRARHSRSQPSLPQPSGTELSVSEHSLSRRALTRPSPPSALGPGHRRGWPADHRIRVLIETDAAWALGVDLARVELFPTSEEEQRLAWLGPDLLSDSPDLDEAARRIAADGDRAISAALLDQGNVAGLGNEFVTEMCFMQRTDPHTPMSEAGDARAWVELGRRLMLSNRDRIDRVFTDDPRHRNWVFGRAGRPCRVCGSMILEEVHASGVRRGRPSAGGEPLDRERRSARCPVCQPRRNVAPD